VKTEAEGPTESQLEVASTELTGESSIKDGEDEVNTGEVLDSGDGEAADGDVEEEGDGEEDGEGEDEDEMERGGTPIFTTLSSPSDWMMGVRVGMSIEASMQEEESGGERKIDDENANDGAAE